MRIDTRYSVGDRVFFFDPCKCCDGEGQVQLRDATKITCPKCDGSGYDPNGKAQSDTVTMVFVSDSKWGRDERYLVERAMNSIPADRLFVSEKEALAAAGRATS
ncbi:MAG TPA: hypothetical protein PLN81_08360 [Bacillota bacterium]|nr:hypothetical protein [Bacillota bacterium]